MGDQSEKVPLLRLDRRSSAPRRTSRTAVFPIVIGCLLLYRIIVVLLLLPYFHSSWERYFLRLPNNETLAKSSRYYTSQLHVCGTDGDLDTVEYTKNLWESYLHLPISDKGDKIYDAGSAQSKAVFERLPALKKPSVHVVTYYTLLNSPLGNSSVTLKDQSGKVVYAAKLKEDSVEEDPTSKIGAKDFPVFHGYSKAGLAVGPLVYANFGTREDFDALHNRGISVEGCIVIVRYGGNFRGLKVKTAEEMGALGVIIYSDPIDDGEKTLRNGYKAYPYGPARQPSSVQRGSVQALSLYPGDPLTPSRPAYKNASRLARDSADLNVPKIPSIPMSYEDARPLLLSLNGQGDFLAEWQGGLDIEYFTGPGKGIIQLNNQVEEAIKPIWNVYSIIPGQIHDELIILGNHRDAWGFGAADPISGTVCVNEIVRSLGILLKKGWKPLRTIIVASWDGEEYGLLGSTEFVEDYYEYLQKNAAIYFNVDVASSGQYFHVGASPSLADFWLSVAAKVPAPDEPSKTLDEYIRNYKVTTLGSGSDFTPFLQHAGIASASPEFRVGRNDPVYHYHSHFDSQYWMEKYGSPEFKRHVALAQVLGLATLRAASNPVLPLNISNYAHQILEYSSSAQRAAKKTVPRHGSFDRLDFKALDGSIARLVRVAEKVQASVAHVTKKHNLADLNAKLKAFEGLFISNEGLKRRSWYKNLLVAPGYDKGYGATELPSLYEAITLDQDGDQAASEIARLIKVIDHASNELGR